MVDRYYLDLKKLKCECNNGDKAHCAQFGKLQTKLGTIDIEKPVKPDCPDMVNYPVNGAGSNGGMELTSNNGRLHLFDLADDWLYKGTQPIPRQVVTNESCSMTAVNPGDRKCKMTIIYNVRKRPDNIVSVTLRFLKTVVRLIVEFLGKLLNAFRFYFQELTIVARLSFQEFFNRPSRVPDDDPELDAEADSEEDTEENADRSAERSGDDAEGDSDPPNSSQ
jgi:hypothetical protein